MGVSGLLKALGDVQREVHISEYRGLGVALDAYCFLHRGKYACAEALLAGKPTTAYVQPVLDVVELLRANGAEPFAVFDGGPLPAKREAEEVRRRARESAQWRAGALLRAGGGGAQQQAAKFFSSAVDVTPEMASECVRRLRAMGVACIVAPCEADAQLAHLALTGRVQACVTEDVDLLAYGCQRVLFGLDAQGRGREIRLEDVERSRGLAPYRMTPESLPDLCVLSGCDYLPAIPRLGVKTAAQLLHRSRGDVQRALLLARREGFAVPDGYHQRFAEARLVYVSQTVFHLKEGGLRPLRPLPAGAEPQPGRLGPGADAVPDEVARAVAEGRAHPVTLQPFVGVPGTGAGAVVATSDAAGASTTACEAALCMSSQSSAACASQQFRPPRQLSVQQASAGPGRAGAPALVAAAATQPLAPPASMAALALGVPQQEPGPQGVLVPAEMGTAPAAAAAGAAIPRPARDVAESVVVAFRPPRLLSGTQPGMGMAQLVPGSNPLKDDASAKRRRIGCRIACM
uniref:Exonuclease 1 n=1 Tax=Lingulaulax polyedra TaxID=160621 RepID=A0A516AFW3_LINPO|nr:exonuclease 1 [Lingulodinium polyedra]